MRCTHCDAKWSVSIHGNSIQKFCPACGRTLNLEPTQLSTLDDVLMHIADRFGLGSMQDGDKLKSLFADLAPHLKKEKIMLRHFLECDGNIILLKAVKESKSEAQLQIARIMLRMEEDLMVMPEAAEAVCRSFWLAIGGDCGLLLEKPSKNAGPAADSSTTKSTMFVAQLKPKPICKPSEKAQSVIRNRKIFSDAVSPADAVDQRKLQAAHNHWSKLQNQLSEPNSPSEPAEDWKRAEAAHRAWINSQKGMAALEPTRDPDDAWKRSEAAHRAWLKSQQNSD